MGFPGGSGNKESACNAGDLDPNPDWGRSPGEEKGYPLQGSCLDNSTDRGAWGATIHGWGDKESDMPVQLSLSCSSYYARDAFNNKR